MPDAMAHLEAAQGDVKGFEKPQTTGIKLLTIVRGEDDVLDPNNENYIEGAEAGGFIIKSSNMAIPTPVSVIPMEYKQMFAEYKPNMGDFIRYVSLEEGHRIAIDPYKFGPKETEDGNVLQEAYNFVVLLPEYDGIICMLSFQSSRIPDGEAWFRAMSNKEYNGNKIVPWNQLYAVDTKLTRNTKGRWYLIKPTFDRFIDVDEHKAVTEVRQHFSGFQIPMIEDDTEPDSEY